VSTTKVSKGDIDQTKIQLAHAKSELGSVATSQIATGEEMQPKPFHPLFAVNP
jgi:hypothetical protein